MLASRAVVITRPADQAYGLTQAIAAAGGEPIVFPAIDIAPPGDPAALATIVARLASYDLAIFVSPTAVERAFASIAQWPAALPAAGIGPATAAALVARGIGTVIAPTYQFDSEGLLDRPELARVAGARVVIFHGGGGRELLGNTLIARGATVDYVGAYRRVPGRTDSGPLLARWRAGTIAAIVFTSSEGMRFFAARIGPADWPLVARTPAFVSHARMAATARALGIARIVTTAPGDSAICTALGEFFRG